MPSPASTDLHADLVVLDLLMPPMQMSGLELLARLHEHPRWRDVPVIITSGIGQALDRETAASLGARQILTKPLRSAELLAAIRSVINARGLSRAAARGGSDGA